MKKRNWVLAVVLACLLIGLCGCGQKDDETRSQMEAELQKAGIDMYEEVSSVEAEEASYSAEGWDEGEGNQFNLYSASYYFSTEEELLKGAKEYAEYLLQQDGAQLTFEYAPDEIFTSADTADASIMIETENGWVQLMRVGVDEDGKYVMMIGAQVSDL